MEKVKCAFFTCTCVFWKKILFKPYHWLNFGWGLILWATILFHLKWKSGNFTYTEFLHHIFCICQVFLQCFHITHFVSPTICRYTNRSTPLPFCQVDVSCRIFVHHVFCERSRNSFPLPIICCFCKIREKINLTTVICIGHHF